MHNNNAKLQRALAQLKRAEATFAQYEVAHANVASCNTTYNLYKAAANKLLAAQLKVQQLQR